MSRRRGKHDHAETPARGQPAVRPLLPRPPVEQDDFVEVLITRARKSRGRGDPRRALVALREACALDEHRARTWTLMGALLTELGRSDEAVQALRQARWLRHRAGERAREAATERLIARALATAA